MAASSEIRHKNRSVFSEDSSVHIGNLPDEILAEIFYSILCELRRSTTPNRWLYLTHVCSHWRRVALDYPRLWTSPSFRRKEVAEVMLQRARAAPLDVILDFNRPCELDCLEMAINNLHRATSFSVYGIMPNWYNGFLEDSCGGKSFEAPLLRSITIASAFASKHCPFVLDVISIQAPQLRAVSLQNWRLPNTIAVSESFRLITSLKIDTSHNTREPKRDTLQNILSNLNNFQHLQFLHLDSTVHWVSRATCHISEVHLPNLSTLILRDTPRTCRAFLEVLRFPDTANVAIKSDCSGDGSPLLADIRVILEVAMGHLRDPITALHVKLQEGSGGANQQFDMWTFCDEECEYADRTPILSIVTPFSEDICRALRLQTFCKDLEHLVFDIPASLPHCMVHFETLEHLWLLEVSETSLVLLDLLSPTEEGWSMESGTLHLPSLRDLTFNEWWVDMDDSGSVFDDFIKGLDVRRRYGHGLTNLHLWKCIGLSSQQLELLVGVVDNLYWVD